MQLALYLILLVSVGGGTVSGRIVDETSYAPIEGVAVVLTDSRGTSLGSAVSDASGAYHISGIPPGTYFAFTYNWRGYVDELYDDVTCRSGCDPVFGRGIQFTGGQSIKIDFSLSRERNRGRAGEGEVVTEARKHGRKRI